MASPPEIVFLPSVETIPVRYASSVRDREPSPTCLLYRPGSSRYRQGCSIHAPKLDSRALPQMLAHATERQGSKGAREEQIFSLAVVPSVTAQPILPKFLSPPLPIRQTATRAAPSSPPLRATTHPAPSPAALDLAAPSVAACHPCKMQPATRPVNPAPGSQPRRPQTLAPLAAPIHQRRCASSCHALQSLQVQYILQTTRSNVRIILSSQVQYIKMTLKTAHGDREGWDAPTCDLGMVPVGMVRRAMLATLQHDLTPHPIHAAKKRRDCT
jgi:hypothetical protein